MADALGIVGVAGVAIQIVQVVTQFAVDWKDAPSDIKMFIDELQVLAQSLLAVHSNILKDADFSAAFAGGTSLLVSELGPNAPTNTDTSILLAACEHELGAVLNIPRERAAGHRLGWERLKEALLKKRTRGSVLHLHRQCQLLNNMISIDTLRISAKTYNEVKAIREEHRDAAAASVQWRQEQRAQEILQWLSPMDYGAQQSDFLHRHQEGTGQWLLRSTQFETWRQNTGKTLYCQGMPGAGKTIMTSIVVDHLGTEFQCRGDVGIAYAYCTFRRQDQQTPIRMLASLLKQLALSCPQLPLGIEQSFEKHSDKKTSPSLTELVLELHAVIKQFSRCYILIDALDECSTTDGARTRLISELNSLRGATKCNLFLTSRDIMQISHEVGTDCVRLDIRATDSDVERYLASQMDRLPAFVRKNPAVQSDIKKAITQAVGGMFLLARLHLTSLISTRSLAMLRKRLAKLPPGSNAYDQAYTEAMERIKMQDIELRDLAIQTLSWISFAKVPLTVRELQHALAIEEDSVGLDEENISDIEDVVSTCAGLVVVDDESQIVRLVHYTTQEFFDRAEKDWLPDAQCIVAKACVTYLAFDEFETGYCATTRAWLRRIEAYPLYKYAAIHWSSHAKDAFDTLTEILWRLLGDTEKSTACCEAVLYAAYGYWRSVVENFTGLHLVAYFGLAFLVDPLIKRGLDVRLKDYDGNTTLHIAAQEGREGFVRLLLRRNDVDVNVQNSAGRTPLSLASLRGEVAVVRVLLER